jgi:hypothetical protein
MIACGGMFGVMNYYHSSIVRHKEGLPVTNHIWLHDAQFWGLYGDPGIRDYRWLIQQFSQFSGRSLVTVSKPRDLFVAVLHAALGRWLSRQTCTLSSITK